MTTWAALIAQASGTLAQAGVPSPEVDARELAEFACGARPAAAPAPSHAQIQAFEAAVAERAKRIPLQHITGVMYFRYLTLESRPGCFIVRPETELVAGEAIDAAKRSIEKDGHATVVDLCTGSGAIAISVATEVPDAQVYAVEISPEACELARANNIAHGNLVQVIQGDALTACEELRGLVDVVVSNPPYVPAGVVHSPEVQQDPDLALWGGGEDGLEIPSALILRSTELLAAGGILVMEHAEEQAERLCQAALNAGFATARTGHDYTGRPRWLWAKLKG